MEKQFEEFKVLNHVQFDYYKKYNSDLNITILECQESESIANTISTVVFIDQLVRSDGSVLDEVQESLIDSLRAICSKLGLAFIVKLHPNTRRYHLQKDSDEYYAGPVEHINKPVFFTLFSTAYLSFEKYGPTYLIEDSVFDPSLVFGKTARIVNPSELDTLLREISRC